MQLLRTLGQQRVVESSKSPLEQGGLQGGHGQGSLKGFGRAWLNELPSILAFMFGGSLDESPAFFNLLFIPNSYHEVIFASLKAASRMLIEVEGAGGANLKLEEEESEEPKIESKVRESTHLMAAALLL